MFEKLYACVLQVIAPNFFLVFGEEATRLVRDRSCDEKGIVPKIRLWLDLSADLVATAIRDHRFAEQVDLFRMASARATEATPSVAVDQGGLPRTAALLAGCAASLASLITVFALIGHGGRGQAKPPFLPGILQLPGSPGLSSRSADGSDAPANGAIDADEKKLVYGAAKMWHNGGYVAFARTTHQLGAHEENVLPQIPAPSGLFGVGRVGYDWTDPSRPDRYSSARNAHRELMVYLWYPTPKNSVDAKGPYLPGAQRMDALPEVQGAMRQVFGSRWPAIASGAIFSHTTERARVASSTRQFPLVIFSHGLGTTGFNYTCLIEDLASRGFVVASIEHTYVALSVWFPDGRVVLRHDTPPPSGLAPEEGFKWMMPHIRNQISEGAADIRFVLNRLTEENNDPAQFLLAGKIDLTRVAAMGHSAGADFAARACQLDFRLKACAELDGGMPPIAALPEFPDHATQKQPLLFLEAYHAESQTGGTVAEREAYINKKKTQLQACRRGSYEIVLRSPGIAHSSFTDVPLLFAGLDGFPLNGVALHNLDLIEGYVKEFLGKSLKDEKAPLLDGDTAVASEATVQKYGH